jgi:hypothetical protein
LRDAVTGALGLAAHDLPPTKSHRALVVEKVGRNAVAELVNQARNHPQRGDLASANPAYVALARLASQFGTEGLALGLRNETGEISFLDLGPVTDTGPDGPFVDRSRNRTLWRQLKKLVNLLVDRNMLGPRKPIRSPEESMDGFGDEGLQEDFSELDLLDPGFSPLDFSDQGLTDDGLSVESPPEGRWPADAAPPEGAIGDAYGPPTQPGPPALATADDGVAEGADEAGPENGP